MKKILSTIFVCVVLLSITGCGNSNKNAEIEALKKENEQLKHQMELMFGEADGKDDNTDKPEFNVKFTNDGTPMAFGNSEHIAEITAADVVYSPNLDKYLLIINFHYTNKNTDSANFINDMYCNVTAYQDGIQLDTPGFTSEKGVYDTNNSFKNIKNTEIDTQLAFILSNMTSDIELELGKYDSLINKKLLIEKKET